MTTSDDQREAAWAQFREQAAEKNALSQGFALYRPDSKEIFSAGFDAALSSRPALPAGAAVLDLNSIKYIDQTYYANENSNTSWPVRDVRALLMDIRKLILSDVEPTLDMQVHPPGSIARAEAALASRPSSPQATGGGGVYINRPFGDATLTPERQDARNRVDAALAGLLTESQAKDERDDPANWPDGAPWLLRADERGKLIAEAKDLVSAFPFGSRPYDTIHALVAALESDGQEGR